MTASTRRFIRKRLPLIKEEGKGRHAEEQATRKKPGPNGYA